jgi:hypothetical protein
MKKIIELDKLKNIVGPYFDLRRQEQFTNRN